MSGALNPYAYGSSPYGNAALSNPQGVNPLSGSANMAQLLMYLRAMQNRGGGVGAQPAAAPRSVAAPGVSTVQAFGAPAANAAATPGPQAAPDYSDPSGWNHVSAYGEAPTPTY